MRKSGIIVALLAIPVFTGCPFAPAFPPTNIDPEIGFYYPTDDSQVSVYFQVFQDDDSGNLYIWFSRDGYRYDAIKVVDGAFHRQWGEVGGTHCPTDAYTLSGHFISPTLVEGRYREGYNCQYGQYYGFTSELVVE